MQRRRQWVPDFRVPRNRPDTDYTRGMLCLCPRMVELLGSTAIANIRVLNACPSALSAGHALLNASCSLRACLLLSTRILGMLFSCPRRVEPLGSTAIPLFGSGVHRHTAVVLSNFNSISLVRIALLHASCSFVHIFCVGRSVWYLYSFVLESFCAGQYSPCVLVWLTSSLVQYGHGMVRATIRCGMMCGMARYVISCVGMV